MGLGASAAQVDAQPGAPQLPAEVLVSHVLPHLSDRALAVAACAARAWRRMAAEVSAARRELVRELVRARRGDLPLMLDWSRCGSARSKVSHAWLQLAPDQGAISFKPLSCDSSTVSLAFDGTVAECPCMAVDTLVLLPGGMQQAASVEACAAPEAIAEVKYLHASTGRAPVFVATFSARLSTKRHAGCLEAALTLREVRVLQPGWLAVQMVEAYARFCYSSWPEACAAAEAQWLSGQKLKLRLRLYCFERIGSHPRLAGGGGGCCE